MVYETGLIMSVETMIQDLVQQIGQMTVTDLNKLVKGLEQAFGVTAAMQVSGGAAAPAASGETKSAEKTEYKITIKEAGEKKIDVIKAIRKIVANISLGDAKAMAENAPAVVAEALPKDKAMEAKKLLEEAGAKVELA